MTPGVHPARVRWLRGGAPIAGARYLLYWIQINQRARGNDALDFAIEQANALGLPVVAYQGLRPDYPGANDRLHTFILEGAFDLRRGLAKKKILHLFHLERRPSAASGLLAALARDAALVVTDHFPVFLVNGQARALARAIERPVASVESSCVVPSALFPKPEFAARTFRPKIHALLREHLAPRADARVKRSSLDMKIPFPFPGTGLEAEERVWLDLDRDPSGRAGRAARIAEWVASCAIDHRIVPCPVTPGGEEAARARLRAFVAHKLAGYPAARNDAAVDGTSGLSPYLHFGQISAREVALAVLGAGSVSAAANRAAVARSLRRALTHPETPAGAFLEQLLVRRELCFNFCETNPHHASIDGLPDWAQRTLDVHALDPRLERYDAGTLEWAETADEVWNAAQQELRETGVIHNRLRMLWGKKILEWSDTPREAFRIMIDLHERYALDGRDPNTYANVLWCLGLHDRPFGPARPVLGTVRPLSSDVAARRMDISAYAARVACAAKAGMPGRSGSTRSPGTIRKAGKSVNARKSENARHSRKAGKARS